mmetsp:Transcript_26653/g.74828  ORF Transcript_26653/g.74828 Transcript_26653/m.74828 type:complete len:272 (+) Transcript_26653:253-1068(+)
MLDTFAERPDVLAGLASGVPGRPVALAGGRPARGYIAHFRVAVLRHADVSEAGAAVERGSRPPPRRRDGDARRTPERALCLLLFRHHGVASGRGPSAVCHVGVAVLGDLRPHSLRQGVVRGGYGDEAVPGAVAGGRFVGHLLAQKKGLNEVPHGGARHPLRLPRVAPPARQRRLGHVRRAGRAGLLPAREPALGLPPLVRANARVRRAVEFAAGVSAARARVECSPRALRCMLCACHRRCSRLCVLRCSVSPSAALVSQFGCPSVGSWTVC